MEKIHSEEIRIKKIKPNHALTAFQTNDEDLHHFLIQDALHNQEQQISVTFLWFYKEQLVSYITLLTDRLTLKADLKRFFQEKSIHYNTLPALKIGRMCVDERFQRRGLGKLMVYAAIEKAKYCHQEIAGCRFLTVDAKQSSLLFYEKLGFLKLEEQETDIVPLYLDLKFYGDKANQLHN